MAASLRIGIAQWLAVPGDHVANDRTALDAIAALARDRCDLVVLPERSPCGYRAATHRGRDDARREPGDRAGRRRRRAGAPRGGGRDAAALRARLRARPAAALAGWDASCAALLENGRTDLEIEIGKGA